MILHIPHASLNLAGRSFECDTTLELERMTDHRTDELFEYQAAVRVVFTLSRLVCDVERFTDDTQELMAAKGMGVCYQTNSFGQPLRTVSFAEKRQIIEDYYKPHHYKLEQAVNDELANTGQALIIDCHSFSNTPLPHEDSQHTPRPDICIGTDQFHTPSQLTELAVNHFRALGYRVAVNDPFAGSLVPLVHLNENAQVHSLMIEVNRSAYQDNFEQVKHDISGCLAALAGFG
jgi:N-formylglutamate amidohydrolase